MIEKELLDYAEDIGFAHDEDFLPVENDFGSRVLTVEYGVPFTHRHLDLFPVLDTSRAYGQYRALLWFFFGSVGDKKTALCFFLSGFWTNDHSVAQGFNVYHT